MGLHTLKKVGDTFQQETVNELRTAPPYTPRPDSHLTHSASVDTPHLRRPELSPAQSSYSTVVRNTQRSAPGPFDEQPRFPGAYRERRSIVSIYSSCKTTYLGSHNFTKFIDATPLRNEATVTDNELRRSPIYTPREEYSSQTTSIVPISHSRRPEVSPTLSSYNDSTRDTRRAAPEPFGEHPSTHQVRFFC